ncbi:unnamed protein product [Ixodes pacificus]
MHTDFNYTPNLSLLRALRLTRSALHSRTTPTLKVTRRTTLCARALRVFYAPVTLRSLERPVVQWDLRSRPCHRQARLPAALSLPCTNGFILSLNRRDRTHVFFFSLPSPTSTNLVAVSTLDTCGSSAFATATAPLALVSWSSGFASSLPP